PEKFITELKDRSDIVDVVSGYVRLTKRSGANLFGLCPFHSEKTPSFSVSPDKQIYHCFGCGKGGGVINFIMEIENLSYPEAVEFLAKRAGMQMPEEVDGAESRRRARMLALNRDAARFFYEQLSIPAGEKARAYIRRRGISGAMAKNFGLGAAPDSWDSLKNAMREKGYTDQELFDAGLVRRGRKGGFYDVFRNRLMFPVIDVRGNVIGFSGRILDEGEPKYLNSPQTLVFDKSRNLFALNLAKKSKGGYILLSEGNIDVVSLHQAGFDSAVASLGTSLTPEQARLISRYTDQVIIAYDNDGAGVKASQRAIGILEKLDIKVKVLRLSGAKDPDEFIKLKGPEAFRKLIEESENQIDYRLRSIREKYDLSVDEQKVDFLKEAYELLARQPDEVKRKVYAMRVAELCALKPDLVIADVERRRRRIVGGARKAEQREQNRPEKLLQPEARELRYEDPASAAAEEGLIRLLYLEPGLLRDAALPLVSDFSSPALARIYEILCRRIREGSSVDADALAGELSGDEMSLLVSILQKPEALSRSRQSLADYIAKIRERKDNREEQTNLLALQKKMLKTKGFEG
ncbi:MAG: DNA primase, partial [Oscillospiraceae bacterium]|nr:DNA primase [Oscillospiraceae bacterium]